MDELKGYIITAVFGLALLGFAGYFYSVSIINEARDKIQKKKNKRRSEV